MTFKELNLFHKFLWNKGNKDFFIECMRESIPHVSDGYANEKWDMFRVSPIQFIASYDSKLFEAFYNKMIESNYKG